MLGQQLIEFKNALQGLGLSWEKIADVTIEEAKNIIKTAHRTLCLEEHSDKTHTATTLDFDKLRKNCEYLLEIIQDKKIFKQLKQLHDKQVLQQNLMEEKKVEKEVAEDLKSKIDLQEKTEAARVFEKGIKYKSNNDIESAIDQFKKAVKKDKSCLTYAIPLAESLYETDKKKIALKLKKY
jgi:hypothetical protein